MAVQKPIQLVINDTKKSIIDFTNNVIKESGLPICLIEPMFKEVYGDLVNAAKQEYDIASKQYAEALEKEKSEAKENKEPVKEEPAHDVLSGEVE
ncbi:MAG TPA: hypothetical protein DCW90_11130 [Lachnospiraceae bacterium]|nr:hypothetical protein [Lachnospiraceae bacterium]